MGILQGQVFRLFENLYHRFIIIDFHHTAQLLFLQAVVSCGGNFHHLVKGSSLYAFQYYKRAVHTAQAQIFYCHDVPPLRISGNDIIVEFVDCLSIIIEFIQPVIFHIELNGNHPVKNRILLQHGHGHTHGNQDL